MAGALLLAGAAWAAGKLYSIAQQKGASRSAAIVAHDPLPDADICDARNTVSSLVIHLDAVLMGTACLSVPIDYEIIIASYSDEPLVTAAIVELDLARRIESFIERFDAAQHDASSVERLRSIYTNITHARRTTATDELKLNDIRE